MVTYDDDKVPDLPPEVIQLAAREDMKIVQVMLERAPGIGGANFVSLVDFLPRIGDTILTQDGQRCRVKEVIHRVRSQQAAGRNVLFMRCLVMAELLEEKKG